MKQPCIRQMRVVPAAKVCQLQATTERIRWQQCLRSLVACVRNRTPRRAPQSVVLQNRQHSVWEAASQRGRCRVWKRLHQAQMRPSTDLGRCACGAFIVLTYSFLGGETALEERKVFSSPE